MTEPITLEQFTLAVDDLPLDAVVSEKSRLENSIKHLLRSNDEMEAAKASEEDQRDKDFYQECIDENLVLVKTQQQRITIIDKRIDTLSGGPGIRAHIEPETEKEEGVYL